MRLDINLVIEIDSALSIDQMREIVIDDVKAWLASAPVMQQLAEAEDTLKAANG